MPDYQADKLPSLWVSMLARTWIFAVSLLVAVPLWKIFHISMLVPLGIGALFYGIVVGVGALLLKLPIEYNWLKIQFLGVPVLIGCLGLAGISYGIYGDCVVARLAIISGFVIFVGSIIISHIFMILKVRSKG